MGTGDRQTEDQAFGILQRKYDLVGPFIHNRGTEVGEEDGMPDFVGNHDGVVLGVEITDIYDPEKVDGMPLRQHEAEKDAIVREAREKAIQLGLPHLKVEVIFTGNPPRKKYRETDWADTLFEIVRSNCPEPGSEICLGEDVDGDDLPEGFYWIGINRILKWKKHSWSCQDEGGDVATDFSTQLQERIDAKASKYCQYRKHCDACWLVVAAPGDRPSSFYEFTDETATSCYTSPFERVFFMDVAIQLVSELNIVRIA